MTYKSLLGFLMIISLSFIGCGKNMYEGSDWKQDVQYSAPTGLSGESTEVGVVSLTWNPVDDASSYQISFGKTSSLGSYRSTSDSAITIENLGGGETYKFAVRASGANALTSKDSPIISVLVIGDDTGGNTLTISPDSTTQNPFTGGIWVSMASSHQVHWSKKINGNASTPTCEFSNQYTVPFLIGGPEETVQVKAVACQNNAPVSAVSAVNYTFGPIGTVAVSISPNSVTQFPFDGGVQIAMSGATNIRYRKKINGTPLNPNCTGSAQYSGPFVVGGPNEIVRVRAVACADGVAISPVAYGNYNFGPAVTPVIEPPSSTQSPFTEGFLVSMTSSLDIRWSRKINGSASTPNCEISNEYVGPFMIGGPNETVQIKAVACNNNVPASGVATVNYTFGSVGAPEINPTSATQIPFAGGILVSMSSPYEIRYRRSYSGPAYDPSCEASSEYMGPFLVGGPNETVHIKAVACENNVPVSPISSAEYLFGQVGAPAISPNVVNQVPFNGGVTVTMSSPYQIMYRKRYNNVVPPDPDCVEGGVLYTGPFQLGGPLETIRVKAIACQNGQPISPVSTGYYFFGGA